MAILHTPAAQSTVSASAVKNAVQVKLQTGLSSLLDQVQIDVKSMPEAQQAAFSRKDLIIYLEDLIYEGINTSQVK